MYMQSNLKQSQNQAEKLKKLSDVKCKVNFRSSQVEAFINREVSSQFLIIFEYEDFYFKWKKVAHCTFYPLNCCWNEFCEKNACNTWVRLENKSVLKLISSLVSFFFLSLELLIN